MRREMSQLLCLAVLSIGMVAAHPLPLSEVHIQDLYGRPIALGTLAGKRATVLYFYTDTCPISRRYMPRIANMESEYRSEEVRFIAVNACTVDSLDDVAEHAYDFSIEYPVTKDNNFDLVRALGVTRTPEVVVLDQALEVRYQGRIDDQYRLGGARHAPETHELADALDAVLSGNVVAVSKTQAEGCVVTFPDVQPVVDERPRQEETLAEQEKLVGVGGEYQFLARVAPRWDDRFVASICELEPVSDQALWIRSLTFQWSGSPGAPALGVFYTLPSEPESRHFVCGPISEGKPLRWGEGEAMYLPGGAIPCLLLSDKPPSDVAPPSLRCEVALEPVSYKIQCEVAVTTLNQLIADSRTPLEFPLTSTDLFRAATLYASDYGVCASIQFSGAPNGPDETRSFPLIRPDLPSTYSREPGTENVRQNEQVKVLFRSPGYLAYSSTFPEQSEISLAKKRGPETASISIYFSSPVTSPGK